MAQNSTSQNNVEKLPQELKVIFTCSSCIQRIATGDYLTRKFFNFVRKEGFDRQLGGGGEGWHGKKGGSINIERFVTEFPCKKFQSQ